MLAVPGEVARAEPMSDERHENIRPEGYEEGEITPDIAMRIVTLCEELSPMPLAGVVILAVHKSKQGVSVYGGGRDSNGLIAPMDPKDAADTAIDVARYLRGAQDAGMV